MIGKSTGIALLMAAAILAALFAMGTFSTTGVQAAVSGVTELSATYADTGSENSPRQTLSLSFKSATAVAEDETVKVNLTGFTVSGSLTGARDIDAATANDAGNEITVTFSTAATVDSPINVDISGTISTPVYGEGMVSVAGSSATVTSTSALALSCYGQTMSSDAKNISSCEPGAAVRVEVDGTSATAVAVNEDVMVALTGFTVPPTIADSGVLIYNEAGAARNPTDVQVNEKKVTLTVPNFAGTGETPEGLVDLSGAGNDTNTTASYRIVFKQSAGITNSAAAGSKTIKITDKDATDEEHKVSIQRVIKLSKTSGARGTMTTATLKGFANGTATLKLNGENIGEATISGNTGTEDLDTTSSKFKAGKGNEITATDASGIVQDVSAMFEIKPRVVVDPESAKASQEVTIKLSDWPAANTIDSVKIGASYAVLPTPRPYIIATGENLGKRDFKVTVPNNVNRGTQTVKVTGSKVTGMDSAPTATTTMMVGVESLTITPSAVVPGQQITITGSGFGNGVEIISVTIGGMKANNLPDDKEDRMSTSSGNVSVTVNVPLGVGKGDKTVALQAGTRIGEGKITVAGPSVEVSPKESLVGSTITVVGSGFGSGERVEVFYGPKGGNLQIEEVGIADGTGNLTIKFTVPSDAGIGQTNSVEVRVRNAPAIKASDDHNTPGPMIEVTSEAQSGGHITITGSNFKSFSILSKVDVGAQKAIPSPAPETDKDGKVVFTVRVPRLSLGSHNVTVEDGGGNSATETFTVVDTPVSQAPADVFADISDRLERVWHFDAATQSESPAFGWSFYDPESAASDLDTVSSGMIVTVIISSGGTIEFQGKTLYAGTNFISLN